jgi:hypothetical protein
MAGRVHDNVGREGLLDTAQRRQPHTGQRPGVTTLGQIEVATSPLFSPWNTQYYRLFGPDYPFELPWPAQFPAGRRALLCQGLQGYAFTPLSAFHRLGMATPLLRLPGTSERADRLWNTALDRVGLELGNYGGTRRRRSACRPI